MRTVLVVEAEVHVDRSVRFLQLMEGRGLKVADGPHTTDEPGILRLRLEACFDSEQDRDGWWTYHEYVRRHVQRDLEQDWKAPE